MSKSLACALKVEDWRALVLVSESLRVAHALKSQLKSYFEIRVG